MVGPVFFLGGFVVRLPLAEAREVSSRRLATSAYLHSVCLLMQAKQFGRPRSHCVHVSFRPYYVHMSRWRKSAGWSGSLSPVHLLTKHRSCALSHANYPFTNFVLEWLIT